MESKIKLHKSWVDECEAAEAIRRELRLERALQYLIGEKLFTFVQTAERDPRFAAELPHFIDEICRIFTAQEIRGYLDNLERTKFLAPPEPEDKNAGDDLLHDPVWGAQEILRFARVKELLLAGS